MDKVSQKVKLDVDETQRKQDLATYRELAMELGAAKAAIVDAKDIPVEDRVTLKCQVPRCISYGVCAHCPPNTLKPGELRKILTDYQKAVLFIKDFPAGIMGTNLDTINDLMAGYRDITRIVSEIESRAFYDGHYLAFGFAAGSCRHHFCLAQETCAAMEGKSCRHYFKARPSMEAVGIDVYRMVALQGWDIYPIGSDALLEKIPKGTMAGIIIVY